jgi:hypothetical protein
MKTLPFYGSSRELFIHVPQLDLNIQRDSIEPKEVDEERFEEEEGKKKIDDHKTLKTRRREKFCVVWSM